MNEPNDKEKTQDSSSEEVECSVLLAAINNLLEQWRGRHKTATAMIKRAREQRDKVSERRLIAKSSTISSMVHELEREVRNNIS